MRFLIISPIIIVFVQVCSPKIDPPDPRDPMIAQGREIFFNETFNGNGRTCGTCHPAENNFTLDPTFIRGLPDDDPLFVAENNPDLAENFENPILMEQHSLIMENLDGFDNLPEKFTMRGIPHLLGLTHSVSSGQGPRTGWSGDGAPGDLSLRSFATGAVIQHFTKTTNRIPGVDFRLPTEEELDALEAFQLSLGRQEELVLPLPLKNEAAARGQTIFTDPASGKCFACHFNAGANAAPALFGEGAGNLNFNTGVEDLPDKPADFTGELIPRDDGFGIPGNGEFNTPSLVEAADTPPFFHNNSVETLEGSIAFYNGAAFNNSPAGQLVQGATGSGINLDATQVEAVADFLRVINTLDNIAQARDLLLSYADRDFLGNVEYTRLLNQSLEEIDDCIMVLRSGGLHPKAVQYLEEARNATLEAIDAHNYERKRETSRTAAQVLDSTRNELIELNP
ncbi:hypothetical protein NC796_06685 [Aliifodinibius sp. S!AR15-10]|uniref:hypothetical protein n=1 Tax=Aliifodinibius sp. S!AR15-10 TaxID=2950437 RepID=UPI00285A2D66|nr:hypothetical protein [Aliifodinibius sp. S!AR15-10]MDR8390815.1 hypothetical protein [Aliifodinibius sp. S!AR15-10]